MRMDCTLFMLIFVLLTTPTIGFRWLTKPGTVRACVDGVAYFPWNYDRGPYTIQMIYWRNKNTGDTVLANHFDPTGELVYYDKYATDRVGIMDPEQANGGLILNEIQKTDEGSYSIEISGPPGAMDIANLQVYTGTELEPSLQIANEPVVFDSHFSLSKCQTCTVVLTTGQNLPADIRINTAVSNTGCNQTNVCSMNLDHKGVKTHSMKVFVEVDYGFCKPMYKSFEVYWSDFDDGHGADMGASAGQTLNKDNEAHTTNNDIKTMIIGVTIGALVTIVLVLILAVVILLRRGHAAEKKGCQEEGEGDQPDGGRTSGQAAQLTKQERQALVVLAKWRQVTKKGRRNGGGLSGAARPSDKSRKIDTGVGYKKSTEEVCVDMDAKLNSSLTKEDYQNGEERPPPVGEDGSEVYEDESQLGLLHVPS